MLRRLVPLLLLVAGCASVPYSTAGQIPGTSVPGVEPGGTIPNARGKASPAASREICRGSAMPRGWIAVDYVHTSLQCRTGRRDNSANTAIIVRYTTLPAHSILTVCADQHLPSTWTREPEQDTDASSVQCPRMPDDTGTRPPIIRIRRNP